jgi:hypothetical protein
MAARLTYRVLFSALLWLLLLARAATLAGVTVPDTYTVNGQALVLNGAGLRTLTIFRVGIYVAALYLPQPMHDAAAILASSGPKVLRLFFLHAGSKEQVDKEYRLGEANNCGQGQCAATDEADFERLVAAAPAVEPGDTTTYIFSAGGVRVLANDRSIGDYADRDLADRLLAGFIGPHPPSEALRSGLLGQ